MQLHLIYGVYSKFLLGHFVANYSDIYMT